jgi:hypothetical protein
MLEKGGIRQKGTVRKSAVEAGFMIILHSIENSTLPPIPPCTPFTVLCGPLAQPILH